jgi:hypothetical protein
MSVRMVSAYLKKNRHQIRCLPMDAGAVENATAVQLEIQNPVEAYSNSYERDFKYLCSSKLSRERIRDWPFSCLLIQEINMPK